MHEKLVLLYFVLIRRKISFTGVFFQISEYSAYRMQTKGGFSRSCKVPNSVFLMIIIPI